MMNTRGRQYRFLFFFTLVAGLIVPLLAVLNYTYLNYNAAAFDDSTSNIIVFLVLLLIVSAASAVAGFVILSGRYPFRACILPFLFSLAGPVSFWFCQMPIGEYLNLPIASILSLLIKCQLGASYMVVVALISKVVTRRCHNRVIAVVFNLLSDSVLALLLTGLVSLAVFLVRSHEAGYFLQSLRTAAILSAIALVVMAVTTLAILLIFRFKIPTDDIPPFTKEEESEESHML